MSLLTKSPMVQRDVDVLADLARVASAEVYFSITTVDLELWRSVEPGTANPFHRLRAMQALRRAGVTVGVMMAPILPGLTDSASSIEAVAAAARDYDAVHFTAIPLRLAPHVKEFYLGYIGDEYPGPVTAVLSAPIPAPTRRRPIGTSWISVSSASAPSMASAVPPIDSVSRSRRRSPRGAASSSHSRSNSVVPRRCSCANWTTPLERRPQTQQRHTLDHNAEPVSNAWTRRRGGPPG